MAESICWSLGLDVFASSAAADMICPGWQYPHCGTCSAIHAFCSGCELSTESPSMVVIFFDATEETAVWHDRTAWPSRCTVHAPHSPIPQPYFVPVMLSLSRKTHKSGVSGATSTSRGLLLISN